MPASARLNPVICIGWETVRKLAAGKDVYLESQNVRLLAASDLFGCDIETIRHLDGRKAGPSMSKWPSMDSAPIDGSPFIARYQWLGDDRFMIIRRSLEGPWWILDGFSRVVGDERSPVRFTGWASIPLPSSESEPAHLPHPPSDREGLR